MQLNEDILLQVSNKLNVERSEILNQDLGANIIQAQRLPDESDQAQIENQQTMKMRLRNRELLYLKKVNGALDRLKQGLFGDCLSCGCPISLKRIMARPTAELCIDCKEDQEKSENQRIKIHKSIGKSVNFI